MPGAGAPHLAFEMRIQNLPSPSPDATFIARTSPKTLSRRISQFTPSKRDKLTNSSPQPATIK